MPGFFVFLDEAMRSGLALAARGFAGHLAAQNVRHVGGVVVSQNERVAASAVVTAGGDESRAGRETADEWISRELLSGRGSRNQPARPAAGSTGPYYRAKVGAKCNAFFF